MNVSVSKASLPRMFVPDGGLAAACGAVASTPAPAMTAAADTTAYRMSLVRTCFSLSCGTTYVPRSRPARTTVVSDALSGIQSAPGGSWLKQTSHIMIFQINSG
ncbi:hypothetical protein [Streptomyces sp. NPDC005374]|uniref:hypothetical protein n=1 Tax=Streptomyces sp. NPDC005374 TaxID=3364713 RepID=UPI0036C07016